MADTQTGSNRAHITVILDRTGSMESIREDTIGGFNGFLAQQQAVPTPTRFTLVQFDTQAPFEDAIGRGIIDLDGRLAALPAAERPDRIVFVIVTDGQENSSREFTGAQVAGMIDAHRKAGWQFVFLSADEGAIKDGSSVNINEEFSMGVTKNARGTGRMWSALACRTAAYRSCAAPDMSLREIKERLAREDREQSESQQR